MIFVAHAHSKDLAHPSGGLILCPFFIDHYSKDEGKCDLGLHFTGLKTSGSGNSGCRMR